MGPGAWARRPTSGMRKTARIHFCDRWYTLCEGDAGFLLPFVVIPPREGGRLGGSGVIARSLLATFVLLICHSAAWGTSTFQVEVRLTTAENITSFQFTLEYDESVMEYQSVALGSALGSPFSVTNEV